MFNDTVHIQQLAQRLQSASLAILENVMVVFICVYCAPWGVSVSRGGMKALGVLPQSIDRSVTLTTEAAN